MGRPSRAAERRDQILDAFEGLIARTGLRDSSMADVAKAAGMQRQLVQHYFGRRDDLVIALVERVAERTIQEVEQLLEAFSGRERLEAGLDYLFDFDPAYDDDDPGYAAWPHMRAEAASNPAVREIIQRTYGSMQQRIGEELGKAYPELSAELRDQTAFAMTILFLGFEGGEAVALPGVAPKTSIAISRRLLRSFLDEARSQAPSDHDEEGESS